MGCSQIRNALNLEAGHVVKGASNQTVMDKAAYINKIVTVLDAHQSVEDGINANEHLAQQGKLDALRRLGTNQTAPSLKFIQTEATNLQEKQQHYFDKFMAVDSGIKELTERIPILIYLWRKLDLLDANGRNKRFYQAAESNQVKIMAAMLEHPEGPMINEETKERALFERAKRLTPKDYDNYQQTLILLEFMVMARDWLARWLDEEVGIDLSVIRTNFGADVADALSGHRLDKKRALAGASQ